MADVVRTKSGIFRSAHRSTPSADASAAAQLAAAMPRPPRGVGQTSASDAASAAEFAAKKYVWVPDPQAGYLSAWIVKEEDAGETSVCALQDGTNRTVPTFELSKMNPPKFDKVEDIADLTFLNEASVVHNLRQRYFSGLIYTYSGLFLVAVNPYHTLPIYTDAIIAAYKGRRREENAPHVFALADGAMRNMLDNRENQSLLITGESGAGKTENTKKVIQYLAAIAADTGNSSFVPSSSSQSPPGGLTRANSSRKVLDHLQGIHPVSAKRLGLLEQQILQANPILEAFGNAQTIRNNNSSRFGKFVRIEFTSLGAIAGANIDWYLLEKSRVAIRSDKERSFHIFYQLLRGGEPELRQKLLLSDSPDDYGYLRGSRRDVEGVDDRSEWRLLREALDVVGFSPEEQLNLFRVAAAILQIGNIELADDRSEQARITNSQQVEKVCHVLGLPEQELTKALLRPRVKAGREWVTSSRTRRQVIEEMAALSKTMYEKAFGWLVDRINKALDRPTSKSTFIGVLDIAGFEIFEVNSFEQLCINYTNEKLQQFFNHHMFVLEQEEYARENIEWDFVNFGLDLQPTIDLIESATPIGVLSCLDEECIMPKATDLTFTEKLNRIWATNKDGSAKDAAGAAAAAEKGVAHGSTKYAPARFAQGFTIKHYAGDVEYRTDGWLDKNKDPLNDNLTRVMSESTDRFIASLFAEYAENDEAAGAALPTAGGALNGAPKRRVKRGAFRTVGQRHKEQLTSLMAQLSSTQPHFVRCIVPNPEKKPGKMDVPLVLEQLRCNGVLEGIRIARLGYPNRLLFSEFRNRYEVLTPGIIPQGYMDGRKACQRMVEALELDRSTFKIGSSKIFFKAGVLAEMEEKRDAHLYDIFARFQAACRMYTARRQMKKILNRAAAVRTIQRNARLYVELREWPWWQLYSRVRPLLTATRHDEELKRKELELAMVTERAERDQREREALEALKFQLESEKKKVEDKLEAERALLLDKDRLLARSKEREAALEDDLAALQADVDLLDGQLEKAIASQKATEQAHQELKEAFDQAAEHLLRLEAEQKAWTQKEATLTGDIGRQSQAADKLRAEKQALVAEKDELALKLKEKDQDLERAHRRMTQAVQELEAKLAEEVKARDEEKTRLVQLEDQTRQSSYQLSELARASSDHEAQAKKKEAQIAELSSQMAALTEQRDALAKEKAALEAKLDTLAYDLKLAQDDAAKSSEARAQIQKELDETRRLMDAKSSEDVKQQELHRMKEQELLTLRQQMSEVERELGTVKHSSLEQINSLKLEVDTARKRILELERAQQEAADKVRSADQRIADNDAKLAETEKARRTAEAELRDVQSKSAVINRGLQEALKNKDNLEKQLQAASTKQQDLEDAMLELERSSNNWKHKVEQVSTELSAESKRRELLEASQKQAERNLGSLQQLVAGKDKEAAELRNELALMQQEMKKMQKMQNTTIVEHVHVLEEAKKYTDRQLADSQAKLQELAHYTKTLEKSKARLIAENEDLAREVSKLQRSQGASGAASGAGSRGVTTYGNAAPSSGDRTTKSLENKVQELTASLRQAQQQRDEALSNARRKDLQADEMVSRTRQQYEQRIQSLERELKASQMAKSTTFSNIEQLVRGGPSSNGGGGGNSVDDAFRQQILEQLRLGHEELEQDISAKGDLLRSHKTNGDAVGSNKKEKPLYIYGNAAPRGAGEGSSIAGIKKGLFGLGGGSGSSGSGGGGGSAASRSTGSPTIPNTPTSSAARFASEDAERAAKRAQNLQNQLDAVEVQLAAGQRVRAHLEAQVRDLAAELEAQNGASFSVDAARRKMAADRQRLNELLQEENEARQTAEMALLNAESSLRKDFREQLAKLSDDAKSDDLRAAMLSQQRSVSAELGRARQEVLNGERLKSQLQMEISDLKQRLERETLLRNEDLAERRRLQTVVQEYEINHASNNHSVNEARDAAQLYKAKADSYLSKIENLEMERLKSQKAEGLMRLTLQDTERSLHEALLDRKAAEESLADMENRLRELHDRFEQIGRGRDLENLQAVRQEVEAEFERERQRYRSDLLQREEAIENQRRRYQQELDSMAAEMEAHRTAVSQLREENRNLRSTTDELQLKVDDTATVSSSWQREKEKLETKLKELTQAYQDSLNQQRENQTQSVQLLAQIRDLRAHLDESELKYDQLSAAYQSLIAEAGVDEEMISSLQQAVERYKAQADSHMENWRKTTQELEQQTMHLRTQATLRRPGSIPPDSVLASNMSPSRLSMR
ncbi:class II myosin [Thecaphora frezii]